MIPEGRRRVSIAIAEWFPAATAARLNGSLMRKARTVDCRGPSDALLRSIRTSLAALRQAVGTSPVIVQVWLGQTEAVVRPKKWDVTER
jgi:hypothetical protein